MAKRCPYTGRNDLDLDYKDVTKDARFAKHRLDGLANKFKRAAVILRYQGQSGYCSDHTQTEPELLNTLTRTLAIAGNMYEDLAGKRFEIYDDTWTGHVPQLWATAIVFFRYYVMDFPGVNEYEEQDEYDDDCAVNEEIRDSQEQNYGKSAWENLKDEWRRVEEYWVEFVDDEPAST